VTAAVKLSALSSCFQGIFPSVIATCGRDGEPNVTYLSQVYYVNEAQVALSRQFFNKTQRNVEENPFATVVLHDPVTFEAWRLRLRYVRSEIKGPLFDTMAMRIQVIASHTGMAGVFRLISADIYQVLAVDRVEGFLLPPDPVLDAAAAELPSGPMTEIRGVSVVSERIARAADLDSLLSGTLAALDECLGFSHSMIFVHEEACGRLVVVATRGYGTEGIGGEVRMGDGLVGTVAAQRRMGRVAGVGGELRYGRAIRRRVAGTDEAVRLEPEIPLPGLPDAQAQLCLPLLAGDRLLGVLALESRDPLCFDEWDEAFLQILANQIAMGMDRMSEEADAVDPVAEPAAGESRRSGRAPEVVPEVVVEARPEAVAEAVPEGTTVAGGPRRRSEAPAAAIAIDSAPGRPSGAAVLFEYFRRDESISAGGEYLIRGLPARILWKILRAYEGQQRTRFSNRELRLDPELELPPYKDNLESRLILLRKRLEEKCPGVRIVPVQRGVFELDVSCDLAMIERS